MTYLLFIATQMVWKLFKNEIQLSYFVLKRLNKAFNLVGKNNFLESAPFWKRFVLAKRRPAS